MWLTESLKQLYRDPAARKALLLLGGAPTLLSLLESGSADVVYGTCLVIALLASERESFPGAPQAGVCIQGAVTSLVRVVASPNPHSRVVALQAIQELTATSTLCANELYDCGAIPMMVQVFQESTGAGAAHSVSLLAHIAGPNPEARDRLIMGGICPIIAAQIKKGSRGSVAAARLMWALLGSCSKESSSASDVGSSWMPVIGHAWSPTTPVELATEMGSFNRAVQALWESGCLHECVDVIRGKHNVDRLAAFVAGAIAQTAASPEGRAHCEQVWSIQQRFYHCRADQIIWQVGAVGALLELLGRAASQSDKGTRSNRLSVTNAAREVLLWSCVPECLTWLQAGRALWNITSGMQKGVVPLLGHRRSVAVLMKVRRR